MLRGVHGSKRWKQERAGEVELISATTHSLDNQSTPMISASMQHLFKPHSLWELAIKFQHEFWRECSNHSKLIFFYPKFF
jgi:hypothetical protein